VTGWRVRTHRVVDNGAANLVLEVHEEWVFRFPLARPSLDRTRRQVNFLTSFARLAPRHGDERSCPDAFAKYRRAGEAAGSVRAGRDRAGARRCGPLQPAVMSLERDGASAAIPRT
jgi:hypothetical protein